MSFDLLLNHLAFLGVMLLLVQSLNLVWKARLFSLGHHGFFGLGAYTAVVTMKLAFPDGVAAWNVNGPGQRIAGLGLLVACVLAGGALAAGASMLMGRLFTRLRGDYFAVATLVFAEVVRSAAASWDYVGGGLGFEVPYLVFSKAGNERIVYGAFYAAMLLGLNLAVFVVIQKIECSVYGLYISAVEDDPIAAELSGINVTRLQNLVFVVAAMVAGSAGAVFLHFTALIVPGDFSFLNGLPVILGVVLGRLRSGRCMVAAAFIYTIYEVIKLRFFGLFGPEAGALIADWKETLLGLVLILSVTLPAVWHRAQTNRTGAPRHRGSRMAVRGRGGPIGAE